MPVPQSLFFAKDLVGGVCTRIFSPRVTEFTDGQSDTCALPNLFSFRPTTTIFQERGVYYDHPRTMLKVKVT